MDFIVTMFVLFVVSSFTVTSTNAVETVEKVEVSNLKASNVLDIGILKRDDFPDDFIFGAGSSAYQVEGAANQGGKGPSIWDTYTNDHPERIKDGSNADITVDQYHRYKEDVEIVKDQNMDSYRFSISWPRILPKGRLSGGINQEGITYYHNLIDELLKKDITPFVTLFHWDLPQVLETEYGGFLSPQIIDDFHDYADLCFKEFGNKVIYWVTLNEPQMFTKGGYALGTYAPGRCSNPPCQDGNSGTEPYKVTHNLILAHTKVVHLYKSTYQKKHQKGKIGITLNTNWYMPFGDNNIPDKKAADRALDFQFGWYMEPLTTGDYSKSMRAIVKDRLPKFTELQSREVNGSFDFIGINYYTSNYVKNTPLQDNAKPSYTTDPMTELSFNKNGIPLGPRAAAVWLYVYPKGLRDLLIHIKDKYNNPAVYITENGMNELNDPTLSLEEAILDTYRIDYYYRHFHYIHSAIKSGSNVKGFFAWSLLDSFEWVDGFTSRFGLIFVDYKNGLKRHPKLSAQWLKNFLHIPGWLG
ncbi:non-cyanogenic beta-glucosidase-like [Trifolium pratense]|uniref:non-cyanogenic beta-glucosidase-like n=1 Tax=Trifolium pratense TaxID=57577 RepID=UPI001E690BE3|nr:non-cyanogenic beta-glucosidase-like [Trifolium pratense]